MRSAAALLLMLVACERAEEAAKPTPEPVPVPVPVTPKDAGTVEVRSACDVIAIQVDADGIWLGAPPDIRCRGDGARWLELQLQVMRSAIADDCSPGIELAATPSVAYQNVITAMDVAIKVGFPDIGIVDPGGLAVAFATIDRKTVPGTCAVPAHLPPARGGAFVKPVPQDATDIIITKTAIVVRGATVIELAKLTPGSTIPELSKALGKPSTITTALLRADADTDTAVINRVIVTAKGVGYDEVLFAIKQSP